MVKNRREVRKIEYACYSTLPFSLPPSLNIYFPPVVYFINNTTHQRVSQGENSRVTLTSPLSFFSCHQSQYLDNFASKIVLSWSPSSAFPSTCLQSQPNCKSLTQTN